MKGRFAWNKDGVEEVCTEGDNKRTWETERWGLFSPGLDSDVGKKTFKAFLKVWLTAGKTVRLCLISADMEIVIEGSLFVCLLACKMNLWVELRAG